MRIPHHHLATLYPRFVFLSVQRLRVFIIMDINFAHNAQSRDRRVADRFRTPGTRCHHYPYLGTSSKGSGGQGEGNCHDLGPRSLLLHQHQHYLPPLRPVAITSSVEIGIPRARNSDRQLANANAINSC